MYKNLFLLPVLAGLCVPAIAADKAPAVVLEIDGAAVTAAEVEQQRAAAYFQARTTFYQSERKALDEFVDDYLLKREAKKENLTVEALLERHVNSTIAKDPSDESLRVYYEGLDAAATQPFEALRDKILQHLRERRINRAKAAYLKGLRTQANVVVRLTAPRAAVNLANVPIRGAADAPVLIVEFADYECAYCQRVQPALDKLQEEYKGKISIAYKDMPLPIHPSAAKAAEAAQCAAAQGKFWEYHDLLYKTKQLEIPQLKQAARDVKADAELFNKCLDSGEKAAVVQAHLTEAQGLGLQGTPSFVFNGRLESGNLSFEELRKIVDEELAAAGGAKTARR
jgi:protein-disulfide isomerase